MTEELTTYGTEIFTKAEVDALRAEDKETIALQVQSIVAVAQERNRAGQALERAHEEIRHLEAAAKMKDKRLELAGVLADRRSMAHADEVRGALDTILTAQVLPEQCGHCGAPLDPERKKCGVCFTDVGKVEQEAHKDHLAGV